MARGNKIAAELEELELEGCFQFNIDTRESPEAAWQGIFPRLSPRKFYSQFERAAGDKAVALAMHKDAGGDSTLTLYHDCPISANYTDTLSFRLFADSTAEIESGSLTNMGQSTAKGYLRALVKILHNAEFEFMKVTTKNVGGYAWAQYGFKPESQHEWDKLKTNMISRIKDGCVHFRDKEYKLKTSESDIIDTLLAEDSEPEAIWELTKTLNRKIAKIDGKDITVGKALLIGQKWEGILPLDENDLGFQRFQAYTAPDRIKDVAL